MAAVPRGRTLDRRRTGLVILGVGVSAIALWLCVRSVDLSEVARQLGRADGRPLLLLLAVLAAQTVVRAFRWSLLLPRPDSRRIATRRIVPPLLVGYLGNAVLPARMGEALRALLMARRERLAVAATFGSVVLERVVDTATLALVVLPAAWMAGAPRWIVDAAALVAIAAGTALALLSFIGLTGVAGAVGRLSRRFGHGLAASLLTSVADAFRDFAMGVGASHRRPVVLVAALVSVAVWGMDATLLLLAASSLGIHLEPAQAILIAGVGALGTAVPSAPGYVGTYELAASTTAVALGVDPTAALALAILAHALTLLAMGTGGAVALLTMERGVLERGVLGGASLPAVSKVDGEPAPRTRSTV